SPACNTVSEVCPAVNITVNRTAPFTLAGSVHWATSDGTAVAGSDFGTAGSAVQRSGTLSWLAGTGGAKTITVGLPTNNIPVINDGVAEGDETFTLTLSAPVGGVLGAQSTTTVTVQDGAVIQFGDATSSVNENGPNMTVAVTRSGNTTLTQAVNFTTVNGTAMAGTDFGLSTLQTTGSVTFAPG